MNRLFCTSTLLLTSLLVGCQSQEQKGDQATSEESAMVSGDDRDEHGCIASAGYTWSEVKGECIRIWEAGIRTESPLDSTRCTFILFSADSSRIELYHYDGLQDILDRQIGDRWVNPSDTTMSVSKGYHHRWQIRKGLNLLFEEP